MKIIKLNEQTTAAPRVFALGSFDGLHNGHRKVIRAAVQAAAEASAECAVLRFEPLPVEYFGAPPNRLMTDSVFFAALEALGVDTLIKVSFKEICNLSPRDFVIRLLKKRLGAIQLCCGYDYHFGVERCGDAEVLSSLCLRCGITSQIIDPVMGIQNNVPISSTQIRRLIAEGNLKRANSLMAAPLTLETVITRIENMGTKKRAYFQFPNELIRPITGVYTSCAILGGQSFYGKTTLTPEGFSYVEAAFEPFTGEFIYIKMDDSLS